MKNEMYKKSAYSIMASEWGLEDNLRDPKDKWGRDLAS